MRSLSDFLGHWSIDREIEDLRAQSHAQLTGTCDFRREGSDVIQHEVGSLKMPQLAQPMTAERRYIWRSNGWGQGAISRLADEGGEEIAVHFDDGRFFHSFDPTLERPEAGHDCAPDRYDVRYDFSAWSAEQPRFTARWQVSGPRKNYISMTRFTFLSK